MVSVNIDEQLDELFLSDAGEKTPQEVYREGFVLGVEWTGFLINLINHPEEFQARVAPANAERLKQLSARHGRRCWQRWVNDDAVLLRVAAIS